jgi:hypothetical protein
MTTPASHALTGGCLCGAVHYTCAAEPVYSVNCHCRDCQKASGSGYAPIVMLPMAAVTVTGEVTYYASAGDSGQSVKRGFCPVCGSQLFGQPAIMPGVLGIKAASLDEPARYQPVADMYVGSAQAWDAMHPDLPKFAKAPPG